LYEVEERKKREESEEEEERVRSGVSVMRKPLDAEPSPVVDLKERTN
jgi:hypothetical protein